MGEGRIDREVGRKGREEKGGEVGEGGKWFERDRERKIGDSLEKEEGKGRKGRGRE